MIRSPTHDRGEKVDLGVDTDSHVLGIGMDLTVDARRRAGTQCSTEARIVGFEVIDDLTDRGTARLHNRLTAGEGTVLGHEVNGGHGDLDRQWTTNVLSAR